MIKSSITHPPLLAALAQCGHKTQVLIADGNYACVTHAPKDATVVYLNLAPGTLAAPPILEKLLACINDRLRRAAPLRQPAADGGAGGVKNGHVDRIKRGGSPPLAVTDPQSVFPVLLQEPHRYSW